MRQTLAAITLDLQEYVIGLACVQGWKRQRVISSSFAIVAHQVLTGYGHLSSDITVPHLAVIQGHSVPSSFQHVHDGCVVLYFLHYMCCGSSTPTYGVILTSTETQWLFPVHPDSPSEVPPVSSVHFSWPCWSDENQLHWCLLPDAFRGSTDLPALRQSVGIPRPRVRKVTLWVTMASSM